jgi:hypothetical protein
VPGVYECVCVACSCEDAAINECRVWYHFSSAFFVFIASSRPTTSPYSVFTISS